ncbi:C4-dicarboxylate ABC transporter [Ahniella affigens]|uniref:C4-dicarboxylate ABC transporter n=1 Tax=Ahniella affigens TaxID=2021234 RepID=A0A2P1PVB7_9GAMM|nr:TRAP transporter substrate-binding protein DctP [Ahniella affigens]AVP98724.1 C4-dicarboxylate ABC transporter [Ahniella affigens]
MKRILMAGLLALAPVLASAATVFKIATVAPDGTTWMKEMREAAANVKAQTEGRVEVKYFPGGVMGNDVAVLRKMKLGQLQGGAFTGGEISQVQGDIQIYSLPFLFDDLNEIAYVRKTMDAEVKQRLAAKGIVPLGIAGGGFAYLMSTKPLRNQHDLRASKVWVPQNDKIAQVAFEQSQVNPIPLPLGDVYTSLQTGLLETVGTTTSGAIIFQWHTKVKYAFDLPLTYVLGVFAVDKRPYDKLSPADRTVVDREFAQAFQDIELAAAKDNENAWQTLVKNGVSFVKPDATEHQAWIDVGVRTRDAMVANGGISKDLLDKILALKAEYQSQQAAKP